MVKRMKKLNVIAPIGEAPSIDVDLHAKIRALPLDSSIADVFNEISIWENIAVRKAQEREKLTKSGKLGIICI